MNIQREKRRCLPMSGLAYFGGDSDSQANTTNNTEQRDMRVVGGEASQNISANDSNVTVFTSTTDHGAVLGGLGTADKAFALSTQLVGDNTKSVLNAGMGMFDGALGVVGDNATRSMSNSLALTQSVLGDSKDIFGMALGAVKDVGSNAMERMSQANDSALSAVGSARSDVAAAWQDSHTPENNMLKIAGFVVVGIAAVGLLAKRI
jgi:hypothetical protein